MRKLILSEKALYYGEVKMPKGFEIDRYFIKADAIQSSLLLKKRVSDNIYDHAYNDYQILDTTYMNPLITYIKDFFNLRFNKSLVLEKYWSNIYNTNESSRSRNTVNMLNMKESPDYVFVYGVDVSDKNAMVNIEYNDNRRKGRSWHAPIKDNHFVMFPSNLKYFISKNNSTNSNTFLTLTFTYI